MVKLKTEKYKGIILKCEKLKNGVVICYDGSTPYNSKFVGKDITKDDVMNIIKDQIDFELSNKRIKLIKKENENHYEITSDNTIYVRFNKTKTYDINIDELISERNKIIKKFRSKKIKVKTKYNDELIKKLKDKFKKDIKERKKIEIEVIKGYNKIYENGLYIPTSDNKELEKLEQLSSKLQKFLYRSEPISIINEIKSRIDDINNNPFKNTNLINIEL